MQLLECALDVTLESGSSTFKGRLRRGLRRTALFLRFCYRRTVSPACRAWSDALRASSDAIPVNGAARLRRLVFFIVIPTSLAAFYYFHLGSGRVDLLALPWRGTWLAVVSAGLSWLVVLAARLERLTNSRSRVLIAPLFRATLVAALLIFLYAFAVIQPAIVLNQEESVWSGSFDHAFIEETQFSWRVLEAFFLTQTFVLLPAFGSKLRTDMSIVLMSILAVGLLSSSTSGSTTDSASFIAIAVGAIASNLFIALASETESVANGRDFSDAVAAVLLMHLSLFYSAQRPLFLITGFSGLLFTLAVAKFVVIASRRSAEVRA